MPRTIEKLDSKVLEERVAEIALQIRKRRKVLGLSATAAAEAAGISRVTWHRIEKGETSVTVSGWLNALSVLGLAFRVGAFEGPASAGADNAPAIPVRVRLDRFPQLAALAWQVHDQAELTPQEAWEIYRRNRHHLDEGKLNESERRLLQGLEVVFGPVEANDV